MYAASGPRTSPRYASVAALTAATVLLAACATPPTPIGPSIAQRIESAKSRANHDWLGDYYDQQAAQARASVEQHRRMGEGYSAWGDRRQASGMSGHCRALIEQYERAAGEYAAMAKLHRQLAAQASQ